MYSLIRNLYFVIIIFVISSCTSKPLKATDILSAAKNKTLTDSSRWKKEGSTLFFIGALVKGDCLEFLKKLDNNTSILQVNSSGGDAFEGLCIAREMQLHNFELTIVNGLCVSSCANYLFLGSKHRIIKNGLVGYHGNITALLHKDPNNSAIRKELYEAKLDQKEIERIASNFTMEQQHNSILEQDFLKNSGISQELFELTQNPDKGNGDNKPYTFLLPKPDTFVKYGILNVEGDQNFELGVTLGMNNLSR